MGLVVSVPIDWCSMQKILTAQQGGDLGVDLQQADRRPSQEPSTYF